MAEFDDVVGLDEVDELDDVAGLVGVTEDVVDVLAAWVTVCATAAVVIPAVVIVTDAIAIRILRRRRGLLFMAQVCPAPVGDPWRTSVSRLSELSSGS